MDPGRFCCSGHRRSRGVVMMAGKEDGGGVVEPGVYGKEEFGVEPFAGRGAEAADMAWAYLGRGGSGAEWSEWRGRVVATTSY